MPSRTDPGPPARPAGLDRRIIDVPPVKETRLIRDEVILHIAANTSFERLRVGAARLGLTLLASENLALLGSTVAQISHHQRRNSGGNYPRSGIPAYRDDRAAKLRVYLAAARPADGPSGAIRKRFGAG